jgi:hypothetical protein
MKPERKLAGPIKPWLFLILGLAMIGAGWWLAALPKAQKVKRQRQEFFASQATELLALEEERNRAAMELARGRLAAHFSRYRLGVPRFAQDLTTWGTRYRISKALLKDWWSKSNEARKVATDHFSEFVVSDEQLQKDVAEVIAQFSSDLEADRNKMLSELQVRVASAAVPCATKELGSTGLGEAFMAEAQPRLKERAAQSLVVCILGTGGGFAAAQAATRIVSKLLTSMAVRVAAGAAVRGSAVATGAVAGGEGGTMLTPGVGTAIGVVGGLIAGWGVDWWTEKEFKEQVTNECNEMLSGMEEALWSDPAEGLGAGFSRSIRITRECHEAALRKMIGTTDYGTTDHGTTGPRTTGPRGKW